MRYLLALGLSIGLSASADAATVHHHAKSRHVVIRAGQGWIPGYRVPGWAYAPRPSAHFDDTPSYDDPSKLGGG